MNLVDSCGWLEYLTDGPGAANFAPIVEAVDDLLVPTVCLYEVHKKVLRERGADTALFVTDLMRKGRMVPLTEDIALLGARLSLAYRLPMADSLILATARAHEAVLWTQDAHFRGVDGVRFVERAQG